MSVEVAINCTVIKYLTLNDISFDAWIDGVGMYYQNGTKLIFKAKSSKNAYVNIFIFNETEAYKLFPNELEKSFLLEKDQYYVFPNPYVDYTLETNKKADAHRMILVFTKEEIPYMGEIEYKQIIDWIFSIPPHMRVIKTFGFNVVNENKLKE
jgi:hypothetical protein